MGTSHYATFYTLPMPITTPSKSEYRRSFPLSCSPSISESVSYPLTFETGRYNTYTSAVEETAVPVVSLAASYRTLVTSTSTAVDQLVTLQGDFSLEFWHSFTSHTAVFLSSSYLLLEYQHSTRLFYRRRFRAWFRETRRAPNISGDQ